MSPEIITQYQRIGRATSQPQLQQGIEAIGQVFDDWSFATGQVPGWSLFAPTFPKGGAFLHMEIRTSTGKIIHWSSQYEPKNPSNFTRFQITQNRVYNREILYSIVYANWRKDSFATRGADWKEAINDQVLAFHLSLLKYLRWNYRSWELNHPGESISEVKIGVNVYPTNPFGVLPIREERVLVPLAKWDARSPNELKCYDPLTDDYVPVRDVPR